MTGTVTFKYIENCYYEGQLQAAGPGGNTPPRIQLLYHELARYLVWSKAVPTQFSGQYRAIASRFKKPFYRVR